MKAFFCIVEKASKAKGGLYEWRVLRRQGKAERLVQEFLEEHLSSE